MKIVPFIAAALVVVGATLAGEQEPGPASVPAEVALRLDALRSHGGRFAAAIRAIEAEHAKPGWTWIDADADRVAVSVVASGE